MAALGGSRSSLFDQTSSRFEVSAYAGWVRFDGAVYDGDDVEFHQETQRQGSCRLLTYAATFCQPACGASEACVDGACVALPTAESVGTVVLSGVGADESIEPLVTGNYSWFTDRVSIDDLTNVSLSAPGDAGPAFDLTACAAAPPAPTSDWGQLLEQRSAGEDVTLRWSNPIDTARIYLRMTTGVGTHGGISPVEIECEGPDTGTLTLPGGYLDSLYAQGWSCGECGGNDLFRYHATEATVGDYTVQLRVQASAGFWYIPS